MTAVATGSVNAFGIRDDAAEQAVIGSMLVRQAIIDDVVATGLQPEHFFQPKYERMCRAIYALHSAGHPVSPISVGDEMERTGETVPDGRVALHEAVQSISTAANADYMAGIVRQAYLKRRLDGVGAQYQHMAISEGEGDVEQIVARAETLISDLVAETAGASIGSADGIDEALASLESVPYVRTPWSELDAAIGGWMPSWHYVIGARPSVGKTAMAGRIVRDAAQRGWRTLIFSQEMPRTELILRLLADMGDVHLSRILHRSTRGDDDANLHAAADVLRRLPIVIDDRSHLSMAQMRARVKAEQRYGQPVLVVNDYLQISRMAGSRSDDRRVLVDAFAQQSKNAARDLHVPWVSLAQLNRGPENRATPVPTMADLREAGGIEASADVILLLHRATNADVGDVTDLGVVIGKNRHGPTSGFHLNFIGEYGRIEDKPRRMF